MNPNKIYIACLALVLMTSMVFADDAQTSEDWQSIDRIGLYTNSDEAFLKQNLWRDYTQDKAVKALSRLPNHLTSPAYRNLAKGLLLSEGQTSSDDITSPRLLAMRLQKLIDFGLIDDAQALYNKATETNENAAKHTGLAVIDTQLSLLNSKLPAICLDVQALGNDSDHKQWDDLTKFCSLRFNNGDKINATNAKFEYDPTLKSLLMNDSIAPDDLDTSLSALIAFNHGLITDTVYNKAAGRRSQLSDIVIHLSLTNQFAKNETYSCYAIEAAQRGMIEADKLTEVYEAIVFDDSVFEAANGQITMHPCHVPAYFYHRLKREGDDKNDATIKALLSVASTIPPRALSPLTDYLTDISDPRADIIIGSVGAKLPNSDSYTPYYALQNRESLSLKEYKTWLEDHKTVMDWKNNKFDPALILYVSSILNDKKANFKENRENKEYGKLFSLTYGEKSLHLGLGLREYMQMAYQDNDHVKLITSLLSMVGNQRAQDFNPDTLSVILESLKAYKLDKDAVNIAFEYLQ